VSGRLAGKAVIVTGAAGGIGSAAARAFAAEGAVVGLLDVAGERLDRLANELAGAGLRLACDVADESSVASAIAHWRRRFDRADAVYICAAVQLHGQDGPAAEVAIEAWRRTLEVNLTGAFLTVKHTLGLLAAAPAGSLILCGSPTGLTMVGAGYAAYSAAKAGMMSLARTVAADYAAQGVRANVIVPGPTVTPLITSLLADDHGRAALIGATPIGRLGTPADLTGIAVYLASDESRFCTGATFAVDGGTTVR
jgi:NAD(P)-dependent dehydrogenase (short-subunit alcohol dehydrogenase family)